MTTVIGNPPAPSDAAAANPEQLRQYRTEGYVLFPGMLAPSRAEALRLEVMGIMDQIGLGVSKLKQTGRYLAGGQIDALVNSPDLRRVASTLMEGPSSVYLPFTAVKSGGGGGRFHFHQDNQYTRFDGPGINLWFALSPMSPENGCLQVVPKSHLSGTLEATVLADGHRSTVYEPDDFVSISMNPGDCIAFSRLTVHGSGPNSTASPRAAYAVQYHRDDVRAVWEGQPAPVLLKEHPRWSTGPSPAILDTSGATEDLDGH